MVGVCVGWAGRRWGQEAACPPYRVHPVSAGQPGQTKRHASRLQAPGSRDGDELVQGEEEEARGPGQWSSVSGTGQSMPPLSTHLQLEPRAERDW